MQGKRYLNEAEADYWPRHESCSGKEIINFGLQNEQVVDCECSCHKEKKK